MKNHDDNDVTLATCCTIGRQARHFYPGKTWDDVEPLARRVWESRNSESPWAEVAPRVRSVFCEPET